MIILVTGATAGFGRVIAQRFAGTGARIIAAGRREDRLATLRAECPGWDYQNLHAEFRGWVEADSARTPVSYQAAFIGFVRRYHAKHKHELGR